MLRVKRETIRDLGVRHGRVQGGGATPTREVGVICGPTEGCPLPPPNLGKTAACLKI